MDPRKQVNIETNGSSVPARQQQPIALTATPVADIYETTDAFVLSLDLPGATREQIQVVVQQGLLSVRGSVGPRPDDAGRVVHKEIAWNRYERQFRLGPGVDDSKINAEYMNGVLTIVLPKSDDARIRQITIS